MNAQHKTSSPREAGFSLVETMLAGALLATVLISVVAMFTLGGEKVKSGKQLTKAAALGMEMMEDFRRTNFQGAYRMINGTCADMSVEWRSEDDPDNNERYGIPNTIPDDECNYPPSGWAYPTEDTSPRLVLCRWANRADLQFGGSGDGIVGVKIDGFNDVPTAGSEEAGDINFCDARFLRVRVTVEWREMRRNRDVTYETLKF